MKQIVKHIHCPVNGWDCPYYTDENHPCRCTLTDPMKDCDDFATFWDEGDDYIDDDWITNSIAEELVQTLEEKGTECGYNGSKWYSLHQIRKFAIEIEKKHLTNKK